MSVYVPGYGTFDPAIPTWLELRPDGKLYNKNASDPNRPWVPPTGWTGGGGVVFTPEGGSLPPPVEPPPVEPPPVTPPPVEPPPPTPVDPMLELLKTLYTALDAEAEAEQEYNDERLRQASLLLAKEATLVALHKDVVVAFQAVLAQLTLVASK